MSAHEEFRRLYRERTEKAAIVAKKRSELAEAEHQWNWTSRLMVDAWHKLEAEVAEARAAVTVSEVRRGFE